jgi:hypothetical protein
MLSGTVAALTAFTIHVAFTLFPKFLQRLYMQYTFWQKAFPNFWGLCCERPLHRVIHRFYAKSTGYPSN